MGTETEDVQRESGTLRGDGREDQRKLECEEKEGGGKGWIKDKRWWEELGWKSDPSCQNRRRTEDLEELISGPDVEPEVVWAQVSVPVQAKSSARGRGNDLSQLSRKPSPK